MVPDADPGGGDDLDAGALVVADELVGRPRERDDRLETPPVEVEMLPLDVEVEPPEEEVELEIVMLAPLELPPPKKPPAKNAVSMTAQCTACCSTSQPAPIHVSLPIVPLRRHS